MRTLSKGAGEQAKHLPLAHLGDGIPDNRALKLVVLHPEQAESVIEGWLARKGTTFREYRNTLIFALSDSGAFARLKDDVKTVLALEEIEDEIKKGASPLPRTAAQRCSGRRQAITRDFSYRRPADVPPAAGDGRRGGHPPD